MVNICVKFEHFTRSETDKNGNFHYYCNKPYENLKPLAEGETREEEPPELKLKFNDEICQHYTKRRRS